MSGVSGAPRLPKRCPVCKGGVIQRVSGRSHGVTWFQCYFCNHTWRVRGDDASAYPEGELSGDVSVVATDGKKQPLASVVLNAIPEHALTEHLERKTAQCELERGRLQREIDVLAATLQEAQAEEVRLWNIQRQDESDMQKANAWSLMYNKTKSLAAQLEDLHARQQRMTTGEYFFQDLPSAISSAQTNGDGTFTLLVPIEGRHGIVARASRELGEKKQTYCWFVWVSMGGNPSKRLVLNNDNIVGAGSPDSALR